MIFLGKDLWAVRTPLLVLAATVAAAAAGIGYTRDKLDRARASLSSQRGALEQARHRYRKSGEEQQLIIRHLAEYRSLERDGFIGAERRIDWIDALRAVDRELRMFGVSYQIGVRQPYSGQEGAATGRQRLWQSPMRLTFGLLHEGDLTAFFDALERQHAGLFALDECTLSALKGTASGPPTGFRPHLQADCRLRWITFGPAEDRQTGDLDGKDPR